MIGTELLYAGKLIGWLVSQPYQSLGAGVVVTYLTPDDKVITKTIILREGGYSYGKQIKSLAITHTATRLHRAALGKLKTKFIVRSPFEV